MGCVTSRPPVLDDRHPGNGQTLRSASRKVARQQKSKKTASYTVKDVAVASGTAAGGSGVLLQPFGSGTSQSVQSFTIGATGGGTGRSSWEGAASPVAPPQHAASGASSLGSLGSVGSSAFSPASTAQLASTAQRPASDTLRCDAAAAPAQHTPHVALPAASAANSHASGHPSAAAVAAAATTAPAITFASLPATPQSPAAADDGSGGGVQPEQRPQSPPAAAKRPATPQQRPRRPSLARISEAGSTFSPLAGAHNSSSTSSAAGDPASHQQQPQDPHIQPAELEPPPANALDSQHIHTGASVPTDRDSAPAAGFPADVGSLEPEPGAAEPAIAAQLTGSSSQAQSSNDTGASSAATASVWNEGDVEDDPDFWARLEAESARATSSSAATTGFAASGDAQAFNDSARSSGGARPGGGPFGAESKHTSGPFSSTGQLIKAPGSSAAAVGLPDVAGESCRDVGSIEGWQALTAQIMGEVSDDSISAAGSGGYDPFAGSSGSHAAGKQAPVVPLKDVAARPGAYLYIQYAIGEELGEGAFGKAYRAVRHRDGQQVVMKTMTRTKLTDKDRQEAKNEVNVLAALDHPNIVQYYECYLASAGGMTIVMEFCDGGDLDGVIKRQNGILMDEASLMRAFVQVLLALQYVHSKGIVHRDLKTNNVFRCAAGDVLKLGDFGIAKQLLEVGAQAHTMVGTPYYMAPELLQGKAYDAKADVWSAGCILHELAGLRKTFEAPSLATMYSRIMEGAFKPIQDSYTDDLKRLVAALLQKDPRARPAAAAVLAQPYVRRHVQAAEWDAVMATEPPAAAEPPEPPAAADSCPVACLAAELAAADNDLARMPNPFGTPSCDLLSLLSGTASGSLSSHGSKSSAGSTNFWGAAGSMTSALGRTGSRLAATRKASDTNATRWRKEQAELDALRKATSDCRELSAIDAAELEAEAEVMQQLQKTWQAGSGLNGAALAELLRSLDAAPALAAARSTSSGSKRTSGGGASQQADSKQPRTSRFSVSQAARGVTNT